MFKPASDLKLDFGTKFAMTKAYIFYFLKIFIPVSLLFCTIFYIFSKQTQKYEQQTLKYREESALKRASDFTSVLFKDKLTDLFLLSEGETLRKFLHNDKMLNWVQVSREFSLFIRRKTNYNQIRLIDINGKEIVRVNKKTDEPEIVPKHNLQDKSDRYYFKQSINLNQGDIYISPLDLNVDQGVIDVPFIPTIRFATPVYDGYGKKQGILVINYTPTELLEKINAIFKNLLGEISMLNSDGYWLMGADEKKLWGFMFGSKETFGTEQPEVWSAVQKSTNGGSVTTKNGEYIFQRAYPLNRTYIGTVENIEISPDAALPQSQDRYWVYVSHLSNQLINELSTIPRYISTIICLFLLTATGLFSGVLANIGIQKKTTSTKLLQEATTDELTGLSNRRELNKIAEMEFKRAIRFNRDYSILMIDLDHFKVVNDTYGHSIGDEVLKHNANICLSSTRTEDLLARFGGEEFVMVLPETNKEGARQLAERICQDVRDQPFYTNSGPIALTVSIGVSGIGYTDLSYFDILERSDRALYLAKRAGRDRVTVI
ncbi:MAG: sensor domain-containing diguanylate cyclase [Candidatus Thiodiazotropha sp. LLP2]